jgi:D-serine deaminase-like pyridoxal phosphate-dependent protein
MKLSGAPALNAALVGVPGGRAHIETPALVLDLDGFEANLALLSEAARAGGLGLRPHAKTHKCAAIAQRQMDCGALGIACAKSGELLALFEAGISDLMLTAPIVSPRKIDALSRASADGARLIVVADRADLVAAYSDAATRYGAIMEVLVDYDAGLFRTGVVGANEAVNLAKLIETAPGLRFAGIQAYAGNVQHVHQFTERAAANDAAMDRLDGILSALRRAGLESRIVSGGGTGSHRLDIARGTLTEIQAGSYIFMDGGYEPVDFDGSGKPVFHTALRVAVSVIAHSSAGYAITDGGSKSFALDGPPPRVLLNDREVGTIEFCGDEYGRVLHHHGEAVPALGSRLECTVPHCDPTVNLHDVYHVVRGDSLVGFWNIDARGRSD